MPTLGELLGSSKSKSIVNFPAEFVDKRRLNGKIDYSAYWMYDDGDVWLIHNPLTMYSAHKLLENLEADLRFCEKRSKRKIKTENKKLGVTITFKRLFGTTNEEMYHGELTQELIDCFEEYFNKEGCQ